MSMKNLYIEGMEGLLQKIIKTVQQKARDRRDTSYSTTNAFIIIKTKLGRFYLLCKIDRRLQNVPGKPSLIQVMHHRFP